MHALHTNWHGTQAGSKGSPRSSCSYLMCLHALVQDLPLIPPCSQLLLSQPGSHQCLPPLLKLGLQGRVELRRMLPEAWAGCRARARGNCCIERAHEASTQAKRPTAMCIATSSNLRSFSQLPGYMLWNALCMAGREKLARKRSGNVVKMRVLTSTSPAMTNTSVPAGLNFRALSKTSRMSVSN